VKKILAILLACLPLVCLGAPPDTGFNVDLATPTRKWEFTTYAGNTPAILVSILTNGSAYTGLSSYTCKLNYGLNDAASSLKTISGTIVGSVATFQAVSNSFPAKGDYFGEIFFSSGLSLITAGQGVLHVQRSPSSGSYGDLNLSPRINWSLVENIGVPPWTALTEPVFLASVAYNITASMTNQWSVAFTNYGPRIAILETNTPTLVTYNAHTNTPALTAHSGLGTAATNATSFFYLSSNPSNYVTASVTDALNVVVSGKYPSSNPSNFVDASITNGLYPSSNPSNYVTVTITNGLYPSSNPSNYVTASVTDALNTVVSGKYSSSNPSNYVDATITNGLYPSSNPSNFVTASITNGLYPSSNPSNYVTASVTDALSVVVSGKYPSSNPSNYVTASVTDALNVVVSGKYPSSNPSNFLTTAGNRFDSLYVAQLSQLNTNISGLTQGVYTGSLTSVSYSGVTTLVIGRTYAWGYTKIGADGTSTLSIASQSLSATAAGATSNHFAYAGTDTNLIIKLDGNGLSICNVSNVYVREITNGSLSAYHIDVGAGGMTLDGAVMTNPAAHIAETTTAHGGGFTNWLNTNTYIKVETDTIATNMIAISSNHFESAKVNTNDAALTNAEALAGTALQPGAAGTWTNLSDYNNDLAGVSTNLSDFNNDALFVTASVTNDLNGVVSTKASTIALTAHTTNTVLHVSTADRTNWNGKATLADVAGVAIRGTYPVFKFDLGLVDGNWTDFEIKASTNNFATLLYYYRSWTNDFGTNTDANPMVFFTDDYAADVRQWFRKTNDLAISAHLLSEDSVVQSVYFYPSTNLASVPASQWMTATNPALVWSWVRVDDIGFEMNVDNSKSLWSAIQPMEWLVERPSGLPWAEICTNQAAAAAATRPTFYFGTLDGTNGIYFVSPFSGSNYWILLN